MIHDLRHRGEYSVFDTEEIIYEAWERMTSGGLGFREMRDIANIDERDPCTLYWGPRTFYVSRAAVVAR